MGATSEEITRDIIVAWLGSDKAYVSGGSPEEVGRKIGLIYQRILAAVAEGIAKDR